MSRIDGPNGADAAQRAQELLRARLSGNANEPTKTNGQPTTPIDGATTRADRRPALFQRVGGLEKADFEFRGVQGALEAVNDRIGEIRANLASGGQAGADLDEARGEIDRILGSVDSLLGTESLSALGRLRAGPDPVLTVSDRDEGVAGVVRAQGALPGDAESLDIELNVTASAQRAGQFLSFGGTHLDFGGQGTTESFVIQVTGPNGSEEFSYASGTFLNDIVDVTNSFTSVTGVSASVSGTGIRLDSLGFGDDEFVSVRIVNNPGIPRENSGVYSLRDDDTAVAEADSGRAFSSELASQGIIDFGRDIEGLINGTPIEGDGLTVASVYAGPTLVFDVTQDFAQTLGTTRVFTLTASDNAVVDTSGVRESLDSIERDGASLARVEALASALSGFETALGDVAENAVREPLRASIEELKRTNGASPGAEALAELRNAVTESKAGDALNLLRGSSE